MLGYIYEIRNLVNNKVYIGQTIHKNIRKYTHFHSLEINNHDNPYLQNAYNKYGKNNFSFKILDDSATTKQELTKLEALYILKAGYPNKDKVYNLNLPNGTPKRLYMLYENASDICKDYLNGVSTIKLANQHQCSVSTIIKILKAFDIQRRGSKRYDIDEQSVCKDYLNGYSSLVLSKKYSCAKNTILNILHRNNIKVRDGSETWFKPNQNTLKLDEQQVCQYAQDGLDGVEIAQIFNCSTTPIYRILKKHNIKTKKMKSVNEALICQEYLSGLSIAQIKKKYHHSGETISKILKKNNINIENRSGTKTPKTSIIDDRGGLLYLYNNQNIDDIKIGTIRAYTSKHGIGLTELYDLSYAQISLIDYVGEVCLCLNTKKCHNNCIYCFNKKLKNGNPLSFDAAKFAIDKNLSYITAISITGGEPTLNKNLLKIVQYAKSQGLKVKIDTSLSFGTKNISKDIDLINISIKNYQHLLKIKNNIQYLINNNYNCELNLVYHPDYLQDKELSQINNIISRFDIPLKIVEMDVSYCDFNQSPSREELLKATSFFSKNNVYIETKANGIEKVYNNEKI